ncbi:UNVERIFIED_CONTAM: Stress-induced-phosphoprotein 1 [Sesamum radiatum]|uniref:Stress-induced-phosphoprotein 1 n=1 Tax=Sesamum radiatum TaxID=300843 RepID=A0AAW2S830_SESRA
MGESGGKAAEISLKDQGNEFFKAGNYLKAAALYTQAIKQDPSNPTLYSNRAAAFLHLVKLNKALADAETTISLKPDWEKGYFRKGCVLEAMERYEDSVKHGDEDNWKEIFSFLVETMQNAVKSWHEKSTVDPQVYFLLHKDKTDTEKYAPVVNIDKVWKGQGSRKWKHGQNDGFFFQFESPSLRKIWFIPSSTEKGQTLCRDPVALDIGMHEILPRVFKQG